MHRTVRPLLAAIGIITAASGAVLGQSGAARPDAQTLPGTDNVKAFIASQIQKDWTPPKTPWGDPDISGVFTTKDEANTPFERPDEWAGRPMDDITPKEFAAAVAQRQERAVETAPFLGGGRAEEGVGIGVPIHWLDHLRARNSRPWFVIDPAEGKLPPLTADAMSRPPVLTINGPSRGADRETAIRGGRRDTFLDRYLGDRCIMWNVQGQGVSHTPGIYGNSFQILQTPTHVVVRYEMIHEARVIPLDSLPHASPSVHSYFGDSRARWEGNTLVVETTNLHPEANYRGAPGRHLRLVERFTRISPKQVEWTITFDDPTTWERPWTYSFPMTQDDTQVIHEYACHEGNYGMANLLSGGRQQEKAESQGKR